jgi:cell division protein FtsI (penicillin-binding protein 3)
MNVQHNSRLSIIFFCFVLLYGVVLANLYILQIQKSRFFKSLGEHQYYVTVTLMPPRAEIYDRTETQPLAMNKESLSAFIMPSQLEQPQEVKKFLARHFPIAYERLKKSSHLHFMYVKRRVTEDQKACIEKSDLNDIKFLKEPSRFYPIQSVGPLVGITDIDNNGTGGIELMYNAQLAGTASTYLLAKDARSGHFYFKRETKVAGATGAPVILALDSLLQFLVYEEVKETVEQLGSKEGAALITNPDTGEILVMANYPDFNPNHTESIDIANTKNRIIANAYELGSVIKAFLALAALEEKVVSPDELIDCENRLVTTLNGFKFSTHKANGLIPFSEVIQFSNNMGVAKVAQRLGPKLYDHYTRLGFGQKISIFPGENKGFVNPPSQWSRASIITLSFGYEMSANLVQLAQALSIVANDGYLIRPRLLKVMPGETIAKEGPLYSQTTITTMKEILSKTVAESILKKAHLQDYEIRGKTGTARLLTDGIYDPNRHIFTYMAIVQKGSYKRIVIIFLKETTKKGIMASTSALPLFERIAHKMLIHDKIV